MPKSDEEVAELEEDTADRTSRARRNVTVWIDFDGISRRLVDVAGFMDRSGYLASSTTNVRTTDVEPWSSNQLLPSSTRSTFT